MSHTLLNRDSISIGITTFRRRLPLVRELILQLRQRLPEVSILVTVNADYGSLLDERYRAEVLDFCASVSGVYPFVFPVFTGLAKMWNTLIVNSPTSHIILCNDDLEVSGDDFYWKAFDRIRNAPETLDPVQDLLLLNGSWSHFCIGRRLAHQVGYFDERLLAFGEEDGDFYWRFMEMFGARPTTLEVSGIENTQEGYRIEGGPLAVEDCGQAFRPRFNKTMISKKYVSSSGGHRGLFGDPMGRVLSDLSQYPYEDFKWTNFPQLADGRTVELPPVESPRRNRWRFVLRDLQNFRHRVERKLRSLGNRRGDQL